MLLTFGGEEDVSERARGRGAVPSRCSSQSNPTQETGFAPACTTVWTVWLSWRVRAPSDGQVTPDVDPPRARAISSAFGMTVSQGQANARPAAGNVDSDKY